MYSLRDQLKIQATLLFICIAAALLIFKTVPSYTEGPSQRAQDRQEVPDINPPATLIKKKIYQRIVNVVSRRISFTKYAHSQARHSFVVLTIPLGSRTTEHSM
jgi:hypothetical protein